MGISFNAESEVSGFICLLLLSAALSLLWVESLLSL
jgi:hypothetical protein